MPKISSKLCRVDKTELFNCASKKGQDLVSRIDGDGSVYPKNPGLLRFVMDEKAAIIDHSNPVGKINGGSSEATKMYKITSSRKYRRPFIKAEPTPPLEESLPCSDPASRNEVPSNPKRYVCPSCPFNTLNVSLFRDHVNLHAGVFSFDLEQYAVVDITNTEMVFQDRIRQDLSLNPLPRVDCPPQPSVDEDFKENVFKVGRSSSDSNNRKTQAMSSTSFKEQVQNESHSSQNYSGNTNSKEVDKGFGYLEVEADEVKYVKVEPQTLKKHTLKCPICSYNTPKKDHFKRHMSGHFGIKNFRCLDCAYTSHRKDHLERHSLVHCKDKPVKCPKCPFATTRKYTLLYHIRRHFKRKRYSCTKCKFSSMSREEFRDHLKNCSAKFFLCSLCNYISQKMDQLQSHLQTHYKNVFDCGTVEG